MNLKIKLSNAQLQAWKDFICICWERSYQAGLGNLANKTLRLWMCTGLYDYRMYLIKRIAATSSSALKVKKPKKYSVNVPLQIFIIIHLMEESPQTGLISTLIHELSSQVSELESGLPD